jgi:hypothetical protein
MDGFTLTPPEFPGNGNPPKAPPDSPDTEPPCPKCGARGLAHRWKRFADGSLHIRETCSACGRHRRWAPQTPEAVAKAQPES